MKMISAQCRIIGLQHLYPQLYLYREYCSDPFCNQILPELNLNLSCIGLYWQHIWIMKFHRMYVLLIHFSRFQIHCAASVCSASLYFSDRRVGINHFVTIGFYMSVVRYYSEELLWKILCVKSNINQCASEHLNTMFIWSFEYICGFRCRLFPMMHCG